MNPQGAPQETQGILTAFWHPSQGGYENIVQARGGGAVLTFKIKRFPPAGVGNRGDSDTKGENEGGDFDRWNLLISESLGSARGGGP